MKHIQSIYKIKYPRKIIARRLSRFLLRFLLRTLTRLEIQGKENVPKSGPLILAGNHVSVLEAALMVAFSPRIVEMLGTGDIPLDPNYAWLTKFYGFIPINRGNLDREALQKCLDVLAQEGVIGIFPEGGIWNPSNMQAQTGVSLLSYKAKAEVIPIGFGGMLGAMNAALRLKRPRVVMNIGKALPPLVIGKNESVKEGLQRGANEILAAIDALLPEEEVKNRVKKLNESFEVEIKVQNGSESVDIPFDLQVIHAPGLARLFYTPVLLDTLKRNLKLLILPLKEQNPIKDKGAYRRALQLVLDYLETNPGFFTYRYGIEEGLAVQYALKEMDTLVRWAELSGFDVYIDPHQKYQDAQNLQWIHKRGGEFPRSMR